MYSVQTSRNNVLMFTWLREDHARHEIIGIFRHLIKVKSCTSALKSLLINI